LKRFPSVSRIHFLQCAGAVAGTRASIHIQMFYQDPGQWRALVRDPNATGLSALMKNPDAIALPSLGAMYWKTSCSEWTGVPLSVLLKEACVKKGASWVVAEGAETEKHTRSIPMNKAMADVIVAYGQNGEPVRPEQGYPLRLLVPGFEGNINVKWLRRIKVVDQPYMTISESTWYAALRPDGKGRWFQFEMPPHSVITFPSVGQQLSGRGFYEIRGLAWSGGGAIRRVEVSTDGGRSYKDAQLQEPVLRIAHTRFRFPWHWDGQEAVLQSRCTDELGQVQPTLAELSRIWGVNLDYWQSTTNYINHFNPIQPWKVTREGSVHNALFD
jgi:sulfane dehydrogenase subunit SoxC